MGFYGWDGRDVTPIFCACYSVLLAFCFAVRICFVTLVRTKRPPTYIPHGLCAVSVATIDYNPNAVECLCCCHNRDLKPSSLPTLRIQIPNFPPPPLPSPSSSHPLPREISLTHKTRKPVPAPRKASSVIDPDLPAQPRRYSTYLTSTLPLPYLNFTLRLTRGSSAQPADLCPQRPQRIPCAPRGGPPPIPVCSLPIGYL
jgi:hypothetical protein